MPRRLGRISKMAGRLTSPPTATVGPMDGTMIRSPSWRRKSIAD